MKTNSLGLYILFTVSSLLWATLTILEQSIPIKFYTFAQSIFYTLGLLNLHFDRLTAFHAFLGLIFQFSLSLYGLQAFNFVTRTNLITMIQEGLPTNSSIGCKFVLINCILVFIVAIGGLVPLGKRMLVLAREPKAEKPPRLKVRDHFHTAANIDQNDLCSICLCEFDSSSVQANKCCHYFHSKCIRDWLDLGKDTCPNCKVTL